MAKRTCLVRGVTPKGMDLRPQVSLIEGRWFVPGKREAVVSGRIAERFEHCGSARHSKRGDINSRWWG